MDRATSQTIDYPSKILGIQFSIMSPEEIRRGSVAEITSRDTYINNKPVIGGLFDPRMGVSDPGLICPTDGLDYMKTPGYFGHITLARPMYYIQYLAQILKILRCVCFKCSKLLISKDKYKYLLKHQSSKRWNKVFTLASKIKRCGEDSCDGCGCKQPNKIKKEGLCTIIIEWNDLEGETEKVSMNLMPELVLKIFRRISDEDVTFMGFSPVWSRPDWMICQVLAVPPPAVRPSVKHDSQQRSEDDLSHIIVNIIKANKTLQDKIANNAAANVITDWTTVVQYYISTLVDNKMPGVAAVAQRSGRPLKSIKERLNGKQGRVRGNLMGKRVDFSARSVITPDPNLSIAQLGVPKKIAMNITYPEKVNTRNKNMLTKLVKNGPDIYPGAKILEKANGDNISLRYVDRNSIQLVEGDIIHRHMLDGDPVLFNRQPTLHRMSMMCHIAKVLNVGDTFRMNVGDTKPYNADFDGDEMNLHMPQNEESKSELKNLAAVTYQLISPANNKSIVGIFQDSLLGSYRFTRTGINFTPREAMNLLVKLKNVDLTKIENKEIMSNNDILSQIMPPLSLKYKTKQFTETDDYNSSNNVLEIQNGHYVRGQLDKGTFGDDSKGLIQRICNDFGNNTAVDFVDNLQNIITEYMKSSAYSVGISDLIADMNTNDAIASAITKKKVEVKNLIDQTHLGIFENKTGKTNKDEFEMQVNNVLNAATNIAGKIGRESLDKDNRFIIMVNAGSKGSDINISQMISCLGQQNVDGKRIPYGFEDRTLPHYSKYNDTPESRGFVESSFISGLSPQELFFHAIGGRIGLIDTAVKTSQTGYIQRRLIKGLEDIKIEYDMTVRNNKQKIIQYSYGDDSFDTVKVEGVILSFISMSYEEIYQHFNISADDNIVFTSTVKKRLSKQNIDFKSMSKDKIDYIINKRDEIITNVFQSRNDKKIYLPIAFQHIINNIQGQNNINVNSLVDITPLEAYKIIEEGFHKLENIYYCPPNELFKIAYYYYLSPKQLLTIKRYNKRTLQMLIDTIILTYKSAIIAPGEMVGMIAAQSIGEPTTQMTLNTFHFAGVASKSNVTRGVPRIEEILSLSENPKNPSCTVHLLPHDETNKDNVINIMHKLEYTSLINIVKSVQICFDPHDTNTFIDDDKFLLEQFYDFEKEFAECAEVDFEDSSTSKSKWILRLEMNPEEMLERSISMDDVNFAIKVSMDKSISCIYTDYNADNLIFRIRLNEIISKKNKDSLSPLDQTDDIYILKNFQEQLLNNLVLRGIKKIDKVLPRTISDNIVNVNGTYERKEIWVLDTVGTNLLDILALDFIDVNRTFTNDIQEIYRIFGIEAARQAIYNEITDVLTFDSTYINHHHISILCDRMTCNDKMVSIFRHGINNDDIGPIAKASFEETPEMFLKAARHGELDNMRGVSANVMCGQEGYFGTSAFEVVLDIEQFMKTSSQNNWENKDNNQFIDDHFQHLINNDDPCSISNLTVPNSVSNLPTTDFGKDDDYTPDF